MTAPLGYDLVGPVGAPVVVLGGSLGTTRRMWQPQLDGLLNRFRVLVYDHLGHGRSPVPDGPYRIGQLADRVLATLDLAGVRRFSYCGLSLGGMVGMRIAATEPERVDRLALLCTSAYLPPPQHWLTRAELVRSVGTGAVLHAVLQRWFTPEFLTNQPGTVADLATDLVSTPAEGYASCCEAIARMDLRAQLPAIAAPTLVVCGEQDRATPPEHARVIATAVPAARLVTLDRAAHLASVERSGTVTDLLVEHLSGGSRDG